MSIYNTYLSSKQYSQENKFYVYAYLRMKDSPIGFAGSPYYIGKGTGYRAFTTGRLVSKPKDENFIDIICNDMSEADAYQLEMLLINYYGRLVDGGCLRNSTDGGPYWSGVWRGRKRKPKSEEHRKNHSKAMKGKMAGVNNPFYGKTHSQETLDKIIFRGSKNSNSKVNEEQVLEIRKLHSEGIKSKDLAAIYGISPSTLSGIITRRWWKHI